jgi:hypothetical protein
MAFCFLYKSVTITKVDVKLNRTCEGVELMAKLNDEVV